MGHAVDYIPVKKRSEILDAANEFSVLNCDRGENPSGEYHGNMTIHDDIICKSYEDAVNVCQELAYGKYYSDHAVRYHDTASLRPTKQMLSIKDRMKKNRQGKDEYSFKHRPTSRKVKFITCPECGSRLNREKLHPLETRCPICRANLQPSYVYDRIRKYDTDYEDLQRRYQELDEKHGKNTPLKWCVKVEVHC